MNKTKELKTTTKLVKAILEQDQRARNSDSFLYLKVLEHQANEKGFDVHAITVSEFLLHISELGFAPFETVRRTRQKIQEKHPELAADDEVEGFRAQNEAAFLNYARGMV